MAKNKKISELPDDTSVTLADYVPIVTPGSTATKKATLAYVVALAGSGSGTSSPAIFLDDFTVNLPNNQTGIPNGTQVHAGDLIAPFIEAAFKQATPPAVSVNTNTSVQPYNQTNINLAVSIAYTINTSGATLQNIKLERSRDNATWTTLLNTGTATSSYNDNGINPTVDNSPIYYKLTITDTAGGTNSNTKQVTFSTYAAPSVSLSVGSTVRERGDVNTNITGTITRNTPNIALASYQVQYQVNGAGSWINIGSPVTASGASQAISINHNDTSLNTSSSLIYRVQVTDAQQTTTSGTQTVSFIYRLWYDNVAAAPVTSANVRAIANTQLTNAGNTFTMVTGTTNTNFVIVLPPGKSLVSVLNVENSNQNITSEFIPGSISVNDFGGTAVTYTMYKKTTSIPYSPSNHFAITIA